MATNRRAALKGGVTLLGAALGIEIASKRGLAGTPDRAAESKQSVPLVLHGQRWRITSQDLRRGELPPAGVRMLARGEIMDKPSHGRKIGDFFATYYRLNTPGKVAHHEPGSLELHTFVFPDGTIVGSGVATAASDSEGQFAIIGGTGRYQGARGSYLARQSYSDLGGDGTATLTLTLI
jgi:Dirigent-like protein